MILTLSILPFSCIGAAIGVWPAVSVVSRMKITPPRAMMGAGEIFVAWLLFDAIFSEFGQWMGTGVMCVASLLWAVIWVYILRSFSKWANRR